MKNKLPYFIIMITCLPIAGIFIAMWVYGSVKATEPYWYIRLPELLIYLGCGIYGTIKLFRKDK